MPVPTDVLDAAALGTIGDTIGRGGQAHVLDVPHLSLPDVAGPLVYKEYKTPLTSTAVIGPVVAARNNLNPIERARLDRMATWPVRMVVEQGTVLGVVMPRIPAAYFDDLRLPSGGRESTIRDAQNLFIESDRCRWLGRPDPNVEQRLRVCRDFAGALRYLHDELDLMFGDISSTNEVYRLTDTPMVMLLDCDGFRRPGTSGAQLNTPDWVPPEGGALTVATDLYKLGLFILRCLTPGKQCSTGTDPAAALHHLDPAGGDLLRRSVSADPSNRPTAAEWFRQLSLLLGEPIDPPTILRAELDRPFVCAGQPVSVSWEVANATTIEIVAQQRVEYADGRGGQGATTVVPEQTCFIHLRARNDLGTDERLLGPVAVLAAPRIEHVPASLPELPLPDLGALTRSGFTLPEVPVFGLPLMPATALSGGGAPDQRPRPFWPELRSMRCPLDVATLMTTTPDIDFGLPLERKGTP
jgi:hypothetical protein